MNSCLQTYIAQLQSEFGKKSVSYNAELRLIHITIDVSKRNEISGYDFGEQYMPRFDGYKDGKLSIAIDLDVEF